MPGLGPSEFTVDSWLGALFQNTSFVNAAVWVQLHIGDPGPAGTANVATETVRKQATFGAPAAPVAGVITISNSAQVQWTNIAAGAGQDATHYSLWTLVTAGVYLGDGLITANAYTTGDTLTFAIGDIDISLNCAF
jgi:hypothetical protein